MWCAEWLLEKHKGYSSQLMPDFLACNNSNSYKNFLRLDEDLFQQILGRVRHHIEKIHTAS